MPRSAKPSPGDYFEVPLTDDALHVPARPPACGQVLSVEPAALNGVACAFWPEYKSDVATVLASQPISVQLVTPDLLRRKVWPIKSNAPVTVPMALRGYELYRREAWVGAKIYGSGIVCELLLAYRGLAFWDDYHDPHFLNEVLLPGLQAPPGAEYKRTDA